MSRNLIPKSRWLRWGIWIIGGGLLLLAFILAAGWIYFRPDTTFIPSVAYGTRGDHPLLMDVVIPEQPNGRGVLVMVSGRWRSSVRPVDPWIAAPLLRRGYTLFAVHHVSQPKATIMEIVEDVHRAAKFVRYNAQRYGIDPDRLGIIGASSGGHLGLMLAVEGGPGDPTSLDAIDRQSSAVQAAALFFPVTDLLNLGSSTQNLHDGGPPKSYVRSFGLKSRAIEPWLPIGRAMSPIYQIKNTLPPILIFHGTEDDLVPFDQSSRFLDEATKLGLQVDVVAREGKGHGWIGMVWDIRRIADWFDVQLGHAGVQIQAQAATHKRPD